MQFFNGATHIHQIYPNTVDGRNLANKLRLVMYRIIYRDLYILGGDRRISEPSTVSPYRFTIWKISINSKDSSRFRCAPLDGFEHVESLHFNDRSYQGYSPAWSIHINQWFQSLQRNQVSELWNFFSHSWKKKHYSVSILVYIFHTPYLWISRVEPSSWRCLQMHHLCICHISHCTHQILPEKKGPVYSCWKKQEVKSSQ